jgi:insulin receptor
MHLQRIDLPNLTDILRGSVRIENNPNLCYASTINWEGICKHKFTPHFIKDNNAHCNNRCPDHCHPWGPLRTAGSDALRIEGDVSELGADNNRSLFCWNNQDCHESCNEGDGVSLIKAPGGGCCSPLCAGGCYKRDRPDQCIACRHVSHKNRCVASCDPNLYEFEGQCLDEVQCEQVEKNDALTNQCSKNQGRKGFKAVRLPGELHGRCQETCPPGFEEDPTNKHKCKPCDKGKCRKGE